MSLCVVVGGQFGSEGKGKVAAFITRREDIDICVRCGGPNSGHSFVDSEGKTLVLRQLPTGFINHRTRLLIPAGALIDPVVLKAEIEALGISQERIGIDPQCFVIEERDRDTERNLKLSERLSSTVCGVGSAVSRRVLRGEDAKLVRDELARYPWLANLIVKESVSTEINMALDRRRNVLIEGTQGFGLSLYHSDYYPHCTSRDTTASAFLSEVGVSPRLVNEIVLVLRTFPIRVAGVQAGPLANEVTWQQIREENGYPYEIEERTSVTGNVRRVGRFDWELAGRAVEVNRPTKIAINGLDYLDYRNYGVTSWRGLTTEAQEFITQLRTNLNTPISFVGVGPGLQQVISLQENRVSAGV